MKKHVVSSALFLFVIAFATPSVFAHCEIPCGIYDDQLRMNLIREHLNTIEKSMKQIEELGKATPVNHNQLVRWVTNKETHANELQHIVTQYFMTQRVKFDDKDYDKKLAALHRLLVHAMKCKQTVDLENVNKAREAAGEFEKLYFGHSHD